MDLTGELDTAPQKVGTTAADMLAGSVAAFATVAALFDRARSGRLIDNLFLFLLGVGVRELLHVRDLFERVHRESHPACLDADFSPALHQLFFPQSLFKPLTATTN